MNGQVQWRVGAERETTGSSCDSATLCETPAGAGRRRISAADARVHSLVESVEDARFCVEGAATYLRHTRGTAEERSAFRRFCQERDKLHDRLCELTEARAALETPLVQDSALA